MFAKVKKLYTILFGLSMSLLLTSGCQVVDQSRIHDEETDTIPWNTRADWEGTTLGVPY